MICDCDSDPDNIPLWRKEFKAGSLEYYLCLECGRIWIEWLIEEIS